MAKTHREMRTAAVVARELKFAENELQRPDGHKASKVALQIKQIHTRPELFQPRQFAYGTRDHDTHYVLKLRRRVRAEGELDPILVVKLNGKWTCVDGHHRLAAYAAEKAPQDEVTCVWFPGTVKAAIDASTLENKKIKLEMPQHDKFEQAWIRVVLDWGSKREIVEATGVSDGMVALMRRIKAAYKQDTNDLRKKLGGKLAEVRWSTARQTYLDQHPDERDDTDRAAAAKLATALRSRMTDKLSRDPDITAQALVLYDPELPEQLLAALEAVVREQRETSKAEFGALNDERYTELNASAERGHPKRRD